MLKKGVEVYAICFCSIRKYWFVLGKDKIKSVSQSGSFILKNFESKKNFWNKMNLFHTAKQASEKCIEANNILQGLYVDFLKDYETRLIKYMEDNK